MAAVLAFGVAAALCGCRAAVSGSTGSIWDPEVEMSATLPYVVDAEVPSGVALHGNTEPIRLELASADPVLLLGFEQLSENVLGVPFDSLGQLIPQLAGSAVITTPCIEEDYEHHIWTLRPWIVQSPKAGNPSPVKTLSLGSPREPGIWTLRIESAPTPEQGGLITRKYMFTPASSLGRLVDGPPGETIYKEYTFEVLPAEAVP